MSQSPGRAAGGLINVRTLPSSSRQRGVRELCNTRLSTGLLRPLVRLTCTCMGSDLSCSLMTREVFDESTGSDGRDDCWRIRSGGGIAASSRTVRRARSSAGRISQAGPHFRPPPALIFSCSGNACARNVACGQLQRRGETVKPSLSAWVYSLVGTGSQYLHGG